MTRVPAPRSLSLPRLTPHLQIREFTAADGPAVQALYTDRRVTRHLLYGPADADAAQEHLARILRRQQARRRDSWELGVESLSSGQIIGAGDLMLHSAQEAEIGYLVAHAEWGRGYGTEIASALLEAAFLDLGVGRVVATVTTGNARSIAIMGHVGLRWEGTFRRHVHARRRWWDADLFALSRDDWLQARA